VTGGWSAAPSPAGPGISLISANSSPQDPHEGHIGSGPNAGVADHPSGRRSPGHGSVLVVETRGRWAEISDLRRSCGLDLVGMASGEGRGGKNRRGHPIGRPVARLRGPPMTTNSAGSEAASLGFAHVPTTRRRALASRSERALRAGRDDRWSSVAGAPSTVTPMLASRRKRARRAAASESAPAIAAVAGYACAAICGPTTVTSGIGCRAHGGGSTPAASAAMRAQWRSKPAGVQTSR
jgi:hypothetical protein